MFLRPVQQPECDPFEIPVIPRRTCERVVGSDTLVREAERRGVIEFERTITGRQNASPNGFAALLAFAKSCTSA